MFVKLTERISDIQMNPARTADRHARKTVEPREAVYSIYHYQLLPNPCPKALQNEREMVAVLESSYGGNALKLSVTEFNIPVGRVNSVWKGGRAMF